MKNFLLYLWQLPQNLVGLCVIKYTHAVKREKIGITFYFADKYHFGVSLGKYIILGDYVNYVSDTELKHEHGHQLQSMYLGWLYLIVIGLPSILGNLVCRVIKYNYYGSWWEHWADVLGGVTR